MEALFTVVFGLQPGAPAKVHFAGRLPSARLHATGASARAFRIAAVESFGITHVEAPPPGTPVVALRRGGTAETVAANEDLERGAARNAPAECVPHAVRHGAAPVDRRFGEWVEPEWAGCAGDAALVRGTAGAINGRAGAA